MSDKQEDGNFWALLRIVGKIHKERYNQTKKDREINELVEKVVEKPKKRKKRKSKSK